MNPSEAVSWLDITRVALEVLALGLLLWAALSARNSAQAAFRAAYATERATVAELVPALMKEYGGPEMHTYGVKILQFAERARREGKFPRRIPYGVEASDTPWDPDIAEVDHARRYFEQFHIRVHALHKLGLIDDDEARMIVSEYDVKILLKENLIPMLIQDAGFTMSRFYKTIPLWERLYDVELLE